MTVRLTVPARARPPQARGYQQHASGPAASSPQDTGARGDPQVLIVADWRDGPTGATGRLALRAGWHHGADRRDGPTGATGRLAPRGRQARRAGWHHGADRRHGPTGATGRQARRASWGHGADRGHGRAALAGSES
ncbi:hypothetical protein Psuf_083250 [Phytohabitans suffuscus]|uniref:Uncharacterized protein n=1 Tax=Phytohabitans suffuscus TaxID=624315 RepID=A0A6F8YY60_9ACTN|nr:hypothetical protein Psuf_083250 [Phytohabitans suffuscus]